jgi:hypothetical protein
MVEMTAVASRSEPAEPHGGSMTEIAELKECTPHHPRGRMTENAERTTSPNPPDGAPMPNADSSNADPNPTGGRMAETATPAVAPNPHRNGDLMPTDCFPDDEPIPDTVRMITSDDAARASLRASILALGIDEVRVLQRIADRLQRGQRQYGFFRLGSDPRAFRATEASQEIEDALVYFACAFLVGEAQEVV